MTAIIISNAVEVMLSFSNIAVQLIPRRKLTRLRKV